MRNKLTRKRMIALTEFLGGAAALAVALLMLDGGTGKLQPILQGVLLAGGLLVCVVGLLSLLLLLPSQSPSLKRGEQPVARWTVDAETWRAFAELNDALDRQKGAVPNIVPLSDLPTTGVEIVVARDGVCIGPHFHRMKSLDSTQGPYWLPGPPQYFEFRIVIQTQSTHRWTMRFPIAPGAQDQAERARVHFVSLWPPPRQSPSPEILRRRRNIALVIAGLSLPAFAGALLIIPMMAGRGALEVLLNIVAALSLLAGFAGLFLAFFWHRALA